MQLRYVVDLFVLSAHMILHNLSTEAEPLHELDACTSAQLDTVSNSLSRPFAAVVWRWAAGPGRHTVATALIQQQQPLYSRHHKPSAVVSSLVSQAALVFSCMSRGLILLHENKCCLQMAGINASLSSTVTVVTLVDLPVLQDKPSAAIPAVLTLAGALTAAAWWRKEGRKAHNRDWKTLPGAVDTTKVFLNLCSHLFATPLLSHGQAAAAHSSFFNLVVCLHYAQLCAPPPL